MSITSQETPIRDDVPSDINWDGRVHSYRPSPRWREELDPAVVLHTDAVDDLDPITYEVIRHRLWTINIGHGETVTRVSGSPVFQALDFNMCILTEDGEYAMNAPFIQFLNSGAGLGVRYIMERFGGSPGINPGDVYMGNDPWVCAVHQMDVFLATPVFVDGKIFAWTANAGHQYDLGGLVPGGWPQNAEDVYGDPTMFTPFKIVDGGHMRPDLESMYLRQSRMPEMVALDMRAQIGGCRYAAEQIVELCAQYGADVVKAVMRRILDNSQKSLQQTLEKLPDGTWSTVRYVDENLPGDRGTYRVQVNMTKSGDRISVDNDGTDGQMKGPLGFTFAAFSGAVLTPLTITALSDQLFAVGGATRQVDMNPIPGNLACVDYPAAVSAGVLNTQGFLNAVQTCFNRMLACHPDTVKHIVAPSPDYEVPVISGTADDGTYYGQAVLDIFGMGLGARSFQDGIESGGPCWSPLSLLLNIEDVEQFYPMLYLYRRELADSGGAGKWRGGNGLAYSWIPYRAETMSLACFGGGMTTSAFCAEGVLGGSPAPSSHIKVKRQSNVHREFAAGRIPRDFASIEAGESFARPQKGNDIAIGPDDVIEATIMGGGGYGDPLGREEEMVAKDVRHGHVSGRAAHDIYGVILGNDGTLDVPATSTRRAAMLSERSQWPVTSEVFPTLGTASITPATGDPSRPVHEYLEAVDRDGARIIACQACATTICDYTDDYKRYARLHRGPVTAVAGATADPADFLDVPIELRQYACPGCGVLFGVEVARSADEPWTDMRLSS